MKDTDLHRLCEAADMIQFRWGQGSCAWVGKDVARKGRGEGGFGAVSVSSAKAGC